MSRGRVPGRLLVCGGVNLDLLVGLDAAPAAGETVIASSMTEGLGGKGANQALAAAALGQDTELLAAVGDDEAAQRALTELADAGVRVGAVQRRPGPTGRALVLLEATGENRIVVVPGANRDLRAPEASGLAGVAAVLCQLETPLETVRATLVAAREAGVTTVLNAAPAVAAAADLLSLVDLLVVNEGEAAQLSGEADLSAAVAALHRSGPATVVVTLGAEGALLSEPGRQVRQPAFPVRVVDTTGAGDCFVGALVQQLLAGVDVPVALRFACAAGALATTRPGAAVRPARAELAALVRQV